MGFWSRLFGFDKEKEEIQAKKETRRLEIERENLLSRQQHEKDLKQQQFDLEQKRLKAKQEHDLQVAKSNQKHKMEVLKHEKEMEDNKNRWAKEKRENKIKQRDNAVNQYNNRLKSLKQSENENLQKINQLNKRFEKLKKSTEVTKEELSKFDNHKAGVLNKLATSIDLLKKQNQFDNVNKKIDDAIKLASVQDTQIVKFLMLAQGLVNATMASQVHIEKLNANVETFNDIFKRTASSKLKIKYYFEEEETKLKRFIPIFKKDLGMKYMKELICVNDNEWKEMEEQILICLKERYQNEIEYLDSDNDDNDSSDSDSDSDSDNENNNGRKKKNKKDLTKMDFAEERIIKRCCLQSKDSWMKYEKEKEEGTKTYLNEVAPLFSDFFMTLYDTMSMSQKLLSIDLIKNNEQIKAIKLMKNNINNKYDSINLNKNSVEIEEIFDDNDNNNNNETNGKFSDSEECKDEEKNDQIFETFNDKKDLIKVEDKMNDLQLQGELKKVTSIREAHLLKEAAVLSINVYSSMKIKFNKNNSTKKGASIARGIEESCMNIICCQGQIRQAYILANYLVSLKPPSFDSNESKQLWNAVTKGIVNIFKSILDMTKISSKFFGFFLKFNESFRNYLILSNKNSSLLMSTENLKKDVKKFNKFQKELNQKTNILGETALNVIKQCLEDTAGAVAIQKAISDRKNVMEEYLKAKKIYDNESTKLEENRQKLIVKFSQDCAERNALEFEIKQLQHQSKWNKDIMSQLQNAVSKLNNMVF